jgi:hypothetical protein
MSRAAERYHQLGNLEARAMAGKRSRTEKIAAMLSLAAALAPGVSPAEAEHLGIVVSSVLRRWSRGELRPGRAKRGWRCGARFGEARTIRLRMNEQQPREPARGHDGAGHHEGIDVALMER